MKHYGVALPKKPPANSKTGLNIEIITDEYVFRQIFTGIQQFLTVHMQAFIQISSPKLREQFKNFLLDEIKVYDKFFEYGKFKEWVIGPPSYRN
ncbi:hypothetical protein JCM16358_20060 [Halanaerocella petrolearia]